MTRFRTSALAILLLGAVAVAAFGADAAKPQRASENVILFMTDGLRWQEVFTGAEDAMMNKEYGAVEDVASLKKAYWRDTPEARREALMPFFWNVIARQGQIYGNQHKGSIATVTNGMKFSYPGYNETLCGFADPRIDTNDKIPNRNITVFEWLNRKPAYGGSVAAFACWDVFPYIFNRQRCGFFISASYEPMLTGKLTENMELLNRLKAETPRKWPSEPFDSLTFYSAMEYLKQRQPRVFFLSLNETDAWGHEGKYDEYLTAANRADNYLKILWEQVQAMPQYRGKTTLIFSVDHGRGDAPVEWKNHGKKTPRSEFIWIGLLGPDTPPLGERVNVAQVTQSQIAATLAAALGEDFCAAVPEAAKPIADAFKPAERPAP